MNYFKYLKRLCFSNKGFALVEAVFLSLIVAFTAMMILRGYKAAVQSNQNAAIRTLALYIAQAQMSEIENCIIEENRLPTSFNLLDNDFLEYENFFGITDKLIFTVETNNIETTANRSKKYQINVKVYWNINNADKKYEEITKDIWINTDMQQ